MYMYVCVFMHMYTYIYVCVCECVYAYVCIYIQAEFGIVIMNSLFDNAFFVLNQFYFLYFVSHFLKRYQLYIFINTLRS